MEQIDRPHVGFVLDGTPGAWSRCAAVLRHLRASTTIVSTAAPRGPLPTSNAPVLLTSASPRSRPPAAPPSLGRSAARELKNWLACAQPDLLVVDGVLDAAVLGRLADTPVVVVRGLGAEAAGSVAALPAAGVSWLAPFPAALELPDIPATQRQRTVHVGFLSPFEGRRLGRAAARRRLGIAREARHVAIFGEVTDLAVGRVASAAAVASAWEFSIVGGAGDLSELAGGRVRVARNPLEHFDHLAAADVVISDLSLARIAATAAARRPLAVLMSSADAPAADRFAEGLEQTGVALVLDGWPDAIAWPALLAELLDQDPRPLQRLSDGRAARRAADWIDAWAATSSPSGQEVDVVGQVPTAGAAALPEQADAAGVPVPA